MALTVPAPGQDRTVQAVRIETSPELDGIIDEPFWKAIPPAADFIQQEPNEGQPASEPTEVRFAFDDTNLYIGIICFDSEPDKIVITQNRRDAELTDTDSIEIMVDTFQDRQNGFIFGTSPTGIEYDAQVSKAGQGRGGVGAPARAGGQGGGGSGAQRGGSSAFNLNWDAVWRVQSRITERGWESEMVIPFKTLRYRPGTGSTWGVNIGRNLRRRNEQTFWHPLPRPFDLTQIEVAGDLEGLELRRQRNLKLIPYGLAGLDQDYTRTDDQSKFAWDVGLDVKYSLTASMTLDLTFNTDFAQVEVDDEQINLTRFDLFFPEKRQFFLENAGTFEFGTPQEVEMFFSRRIGIDPSGVEVPIDAGVRLSGKAGKYNIGVLNMLTREVDFVSPANNFTVARVSREFKNRSSVGVIGVNRQSVDHSELAHPYNRTFGADANIGIGRYANWFSYVSKTFTPGLADHDVAYSSALHYDDENHRGDIGYIEVGRNFNPEVGFVKRVGFRKPYFGYRYTFRPEGERLRSWAPHFQWNSWYTRSTNEKESGFEHYHLDSRWQDGGRLGIAWNRNFERLDNPFEVFPGIQIPPGRYQFGEAVLNYGTDPTARFFADGSASAGDFYNGTIRGININGGYNHSKNIILSGGYVRNWIRLPQGGFNTDLIGMRFQWSFTPKRYLQTFTQYNSQTHQVGTNIRLALLTTSSTGFFLVFNTRAATVNFLDPHDVPRRTQNRVLFFKYSYLFDF